MPPVARMFISLEANVAKFARGMTTATSLAGRVASAIAGKFVGVGRAIGRVFTSIPGLIAAAGAAFGAYRFVRSLDEAAELVDKIGKDSKRLGLSVELFSALRFAAGEAGQDVESLAASIGKLGKNVATLVAGGQTRTRVGQVLVQLTDGADQVRDLGSLLPEIAAGIQSAGSQAEKLRLAEKFFGREGGQKFLTTLAETGDLVGGLATQMERARRLGVVFTEDQVEKLTAYRDAVGRVSEAWLGLRVRIVTQIAPVITRLLNQTASAIAAVPDIVAQLAKAFDDTAEGAEVRDNLTQFAHEAWQLFKDVFFGGLEVAWNNVANGISARLGLVVEDLYAKLMDLWAKLPFSGSDAEREARALADRVARPFQDRLDEKLREIDPISADTRIEQWLINIGTSATYAWTALDRAGKISKNVTARSMDIAAEAAGTLGEKLKDTEFWATSLGQRLIEFGDEAGKKISGMASSISDEFAELTIEGQAAFDELAKSFSKMLLSMFYQKLIFQPLLDFAGGQFAGLFGPGRTSTGPGAGTQIPDVVGGPTYSAKGNVFGDGVLRKFAAGGVFTGPAYFRTRDGKRNVVGEAGWEAAVPLERIGGKLGVNATGRVVVNVYNQAGADVGVRERTSGDGGRVIDLVIQRAVNRGLSDGTFDAAMRANYGAGRRGVKR